MFGISIEHVLILGVVLLIFGPKRLPELGNTLGKAIRNFKDAISGVEEAQFRRLNSESKEAPKAEKTQEPQPDLLSKDAALRLDPLEKYNHLNSENKPTEAPHV